MKTLSSKKTGLLVKKASSNGKSFASKSWTARCWLSCFRSFVPASDAMASGVLAIGKGLPNLLRVTLCGSLRRDWVREGINSRKLRTVRAEIRCIVVDTVGVGGTGKVHLTS